MTNTNTTAITQKTSHRFGTLLVLVAVLAMLAAMLLTAARPAHASTTFTVNLPTDVADADPSDGLCDVAPLPDGSQCTLRAAIEQANATPGADVINFDIPAAFCGASTGVCTIAPASALPPITERVTINGYTQTGASPNTLAKGTNAAPKIELDGTDLPHDNGLELRGSSGSVIRGLVIDHFSTGITLDGGTASNRIEGNFIGTDPSGTIDRGNSNGVFLDGASQNAIGGTAPGARNLVSGNDNQGIFIVAGDANKVLDNLVGTDKSGTGALANAQIGVALSSESFTGTTANRIGNGTSAGSNTVAFNGGAGIVVASNGAVRNPISRNSAFSNGGLGVDLVDFVSENGGFGVTPNDPGDADAGPNGLQNFPVITSAKSSSATAIAGKLNSTRRSIFTIEFFSNPSFTDEGKKFIGKKSVTTDRSGKATFVFKPRHKVPVGQAITATATGGSGNTSEFSAPRQVVKK